MTAILLTAGKRIARNLTEVSIHFKPTPHLMFPGASDGPAIAACWCSNCSRTRASDKRGRPRSQVRSELGQDEVSLRRSVGVEEPPRAYPGCCSTSCKATRRCSRADWIDKASQIVDPIVERWRSSRRMIFRTTGPVRGSALDHELAHDQSLPRWPLPCELLTAADGRRERANRLAERHVGIREPVRNGRIGPCQQCDHLVAFS